MESDSRLRILVEGWIKYPHSYALVNVYQLLALNKNPRIKLYLKETQPFSENWPVIDDLTDLILTSEEQKTLDSIERWDKSKKVDLLYRISYPYELATARMSLKYPMVVFYTAEYQVLQDKHCIGGNAADFMKKCFDRVIIPITPSKWSAQALLRKNYDPLVVPHGVDVKKYYPHTDTIGRTEMRNACNIPDSAYVFLSVGAMTGNKNVTGMIKAWYRLTHLNPNVYLVLKGIGDMYKCENYVNAALKELKQSGVIDKKHWKTVVHQLVFINEFFSYKDMCKLYNSADCYLSPYKAEGFNMPVMEAAACGLPVIVSKGGSTDDFTNETFARYPRTLVKTEHSGERYLIVDEVSLQETMLEVCNDTSFAESAKLASVQFMKDNYTWDSIAERLYSFIKFITPDPMLSKTDIPHLQTSCRF